KEGDHVSINVAEVSAAVKPTWRNGLRRGLSLQQVRRSIMTASDPGPMPDILKREPPTPPTQVQPQVGRVNYHDLSATELAKLINDEYDVILSTERTNYPKAISIGEKLAHLRRGADRWEWKTKLEALCPHISYETATKYIRVWRFQRGIEAAAAAERENVGTTFLTIERALGLIATKREKKSEDREKKSEDNDKNGGN